MQYSPYLVMLNLWLTLAVTLGFFEDIYIPAHHLPNPNHFVAQSINRWHCLYLLIILGWTLNIIQKHIHMISFFFFMHNSLSFCVKHHAYMPSMKITARMAYGFGIMTNKHHILLMILMWLGFFAFHVNCIVCLEHEEHTKFWLPMWQIKFRVQSVSYPPIPVEQPKESKPFAPMLITVSILFTIFLPLLSSLPWFMHFCEYFKLQEIYGFLNCTYWKYLCSWW